MFVDLVLLTVALALAYDVGRGLTTDIIGWGQAVRRRSEEPVEFWGQLAFALGGAVAMFVTLAWRWGTGEFPEIPLIQIVVAVWFSILFGRQIAKGRMSVGTVSFAREEEPREFWLILIAGLLALGAVWWTLLDKTVSVLA